MQGVLGCKNMRSVRGERAQGVRGVQGGVSHPVKLSLPDFLCYLDSDDILSPGPCEPMIHGCPGIQPSLLAVHRFITSFLNFLLPGRKIFMFCDSEIFDTPTRHIYYVQ